MSMQLSEAQKEYLRGRWRQNESDYLRDRRRKVDVNAFVKLKTIGHGEPGFSCMRYSYRLRVSRCIWSGLPCARAVVGPTFCNETGDEMNDSLILSTNFIIPPFIYRSYS